LLYELLTGSPPFSRKELEKAGMLEMLRVIREQEPSKPSTKLSTAEGLPTLAADGGTDPAKLSSRARRARCWVAMKAVGGERAREGRGPPLGDGQRLRAGRAALPGRRAGAGVPAECGVSDAEVCAAQQGARAGRGARRLGADRGDHRHDAGDVARHGSRGGR